MRPVGDLHRATGPVERLGPFVRVLVGCPYGVRPPGPVGTAQQPGLPGEGRLRREGDLPGEGRLGGERHLSGERGLGRERCLSREGGLGRERCLSREGGLRRLGRLLRPTRLARLGRERGLAGAGSRGLAGLRVRPRGRLRAFGGRVGRCAQLAAPTGAAGLVRRGGGARLGLGLRLRLLRL
ncbi:hypothetical protein STRIP9103_04657 [Streptomyces ipomoeae 91-03]|uniref:Uncharacterized protein n=1 Tax=Streptomyces ipomoeae 91-03 TaxID=698759 RepID=L1KW34_9ACTN|nr:hypothetical protein STRIP9103_04657 [Streptomyces ipomoeae 91-03]